MLFEAMKDGMKEMKPNPPETVVSAGTDPSTVSTSKRQATRLAQAAGAIADAVIIAARPNAPTLEIRRIVSEKCRRAGLPAPSDRSLSARIAYVRRHGTGSHRAPALVAELRRMVDAAQPFEAGDQR